MSKLDRIVISLCFEIGHQIPGSGSWESYIKTIHLLTLVFQCSFPIIEAGVQCCVSCQSLYCGGTSRYILIINQALFTCIWLILSLISFSISSGLHYPYSVPVLPWDVKQSSRSYSYHKWGSEGEIPKALWSFLQSLARIYLPASVLSFSYYTKQILSNLEDHHCFFFRHVHNSHWISLKFASRRISRRTYGSWCFLFMDLNT